MKNHSNRSFYNLAFGIALLILILIGIMSFRASRQAEEYDNLVSHTYTVIEKMDSLLLNLGDAESMQRGLIITSDRNYAIAYDSIVKNFPVRISQLRQLTLDNPSQTIRLDSIEQMVDDKVEWMDTSIQVLNKYGREAAISKLKTGTGWTIMHSIRQLVYEAQVEEKDLLKERKEFKKEYTSNLYVIFLSGGILSLVILILIFIFLKKEIIRRRQIEDNLRLHQDHLNDLVSQRTEELRTSRQRWITTLESIGDAVIATDSKGIITFINSMGQILTGWSRDDAVGQYVKKVFHVVNEDTLKEIICPVEHVIQEGTAKHLENHTILLTRDGRSIPVDDSAAPIKDDHGNMSGVILVFRNVSERRKAEKAVRESEERFSKAFHNNPASLSISQLSDGHFIDVNDNFIELFGYSREEVLGKNSTELKLFYDPLERFYLLKEIREKGKITNLETKGRTKKGEIVTILVSVEIIGFKGQDHILYSFIDVTERKKMEQTLRENEQRLKYHLENSPLAVVEWNANYLVTQWSKEAEHIFGWKSSEVLGKFIGSLEMIYKDDIPVVNRTMERLSSGRELTVISTNRNLTKSGKIIVCTWYNSVLLDKEGKMSSVLSLIEDITEIRNAENNLREAQDKLHMALESGNIGIWQWDTVTDQVNWDPRMAKMFGIDSPDRVKNYKQFEELVHEEDLAHVRKAFYKTLHDGTPFETIFRTKERAGESKYISTKGQLYRDKDGNPISMLGVCFDITGMKKGAEQNLLQLHEELLRSNKELERFAYVASHDLQEPLRMVSSYTQLLEKRYHDKLDQDAREFIRFAVDGANRMQALINGLLAYSRIHTRGRDFIQVDLQKIMEVVLMNLKVKIAERNAILQIGELPIVMADEGQMIQLLQNLVTNAIKFSKDQPKISISCEKEKSDYIITVKDQGIGISPEHFDRIFQLFHRLVSRNEYEGTGLGLAICKRIVERHGGSIWVESEPGKGSTFYFKLPQPTGIEFQVSRSILHDIPLE